MSYLSQLRSKVNYEKDIARCGNCKSYKPPYVYLKKDSQTARSKPICTLHFFDVAVNSLCDKWTGKDGATLEKSAPCKFQQAR